MTPTEEATAIAIEIDFAKLFTQWEARGLPRDSLIPMALFYTLDVGRRAGLSYERAAELLKAIYGQER
jgi:hypothetical protein